MTRLHRYSSRTWLISGSALTVRQLYPRGPWQVRAILDAELLDFDDRVGLDAWISANGLRRCTFPTLAAGVQAVTAISAADPPPVPAAAPRLTRQADGSYMHAGYVTFRFTDSTWQTLDADGRRIGISNTLMGAARRIAGHRARASA